MKPWEETWEFDDGGGYPPRIHTPGATVAPDVDPDGAYEWKAPDVERFRLAAAAPEMARLLVCYRETGFLLNVDVDRVLRKAGVIE